MDEHLYELMGAQIQTLMLFRGEIRHSRAASRRAQASSGFTATIQGAYSLLTLQPLGNSSSNPEKALCKSRFQLIVNRYFQVKSTLGMYQI